MKLIQSQVQRLSQQQLQSVELLQMSTLEMEAYVQELAMSNPFVEPEELFSPPETGGDDELLNKLRWLEENDHQNHFYQHMEAEELDPLTRASTDGGLEETLFRFISRQLYQVELDEDDAQTVRYLAACLNDDGYFQISLEELSQSSRIALSRLERCLAVLRSLEPAGIGAANLSDCLVLQLQRIHETGPALAIARDHLELLAKRHYRAIAAKLDIPVEAVQQAEKIIQELDPRPGVIFQRLEQIPYIHPDIFVEGLDGRFIVRTRRGDCPVFRINDYYRKLLAQSEDEEVKDYLFTKLHQAENVLWAIGQRENTLLRCAQAIADRQGAFFRLGPQALIPLRMADIAAELEVHESTISRAVRGKYLQCVKGVYPLSYFFSRPATERGTTELGGTAARTLLQQLITGEDKRYPLSDQKLCDLMAREGCPISRRTAAKYRKELNIPGAFGRKQS